MIFLVFIVVEIINGRGYGNMFIYIGVNVRRKCGEILGFVFGFLG